MRIRTVKPEWLEDEKMALASPPARVMSIGLILLSDDYGNGRANLPMLSTRIFPGDSRLGKPAFDDLVSMGFLRTYEVRGQSYYSIHNWSRHQKVDRPGKPRVPGPSEASSVTSENFLVPHANPRESLATDLDHYHDLDQGREGNSAPAHVASPKPKRDPNVMKLWQLQAELRSELIADGIAGNGIAVTPSPAALADLRECLAEHGYEICEHVLRVYAAEARKTRNLRWLNGVYNWVPRSVRSRVGQTLDDAASQAKSPPKVRMQRVARNGVIVEEPIPACYLNRTGSLGDGPV